MIEMSLSETATLLDGRLTGSDRQFHGVGIDSRLLNVDELFVALPGEHCDGHTFLPAAAERGAAGALVTRAVDDLPCVEVADTRDALGQLARAWRARMSVAVIGVTGSNGKTTVKELIAAILTRAGPTLATSGNYNNHIGVPLTLFGLGSEHRYAVIEMGANHPQEIAYLSSLAVPEVGVVTNAAAAHLEGFGSIEGVATAKGELFAALPDDGIAVINVDDPFASLWRDMAGSRRTIGFGLASTADVTASDVRESRFALQLAGDSREVQLSLPGRHNVLNALAAAACAHALDIGIDDIAAGLQAVQPVAGRTQWKTTEAGARLMDDSYNANPASLTAALDLLATEPGERWLVLGDMGELGDQAMVLHRGVAELANAAGVTRLYTLGPLAALATEGFNGDARVFDDVDALIADARSGLGEQVTCLVKGSRAMGMERVVNALVRRDGGN